MGASSGLASGTPGQRVGERVRASDHRRLGGLILGVQVSADGHRGLDPADAGESPDLVSSTWNRQERLA
jgi:hypothetical protein